MPRAQVLGFEWGFLDEISRWTLGIAVLLAACGALITHRASSAIKARC